MCSDKRPADWEGGRGRVLCGPQVISMEMPSRQLIEKSAVQRRDPGGAINLGTLHTELIFKVLGLHESSQHERVYTSLKKGPRAWNAWRVKGKDGAAQKK